MKPKPTKPCTICGLKDWWWRDTFGPGEWLCGRCHPNPNKNSEGKMEKEKIELINGHFVKKGNEQGAKQREEVKPEESKVILKEYSEEVLVLKERVVSGNQKLFDAWLKIRAISDNKEEWLKQLDRWSEAAKKLHLLCSELKCNGYEDCLYLNESGKKTKRCLDEPGGWFCQVCPSNKQYWEKELMDLPSG